MSLSDTKDILYETFSFAGKASMEKYKINFHKKNKKINKIKLLANNYLLSNKKGDIKPDFTKIINNEKIEKSNFFNFTYRERKKTLYQGKKYMYHNRSKKLIDLKRNQIKLRNDQEVLTPLFFQGINNDPSKIKSGVNWKKIIGRKPIDKEKEDLYKNYSDINIKAYNDKQKGFVDMSKQTQRDDNFLINNIRNIIGKKYVKINFKLEKEKWKQFCRKPLVPRSPFSSDFYNRIYRRLIPFSCKNNKKINRRISPNQFDMKNKYLSPNKQHSIIDFNKTTGRKNLFSNMIVKDSTPKVLLYPNYNFIEEKVKNMVLYRNEKKRKVKNEIRNAIWDEYYLTINNFENIYGHKLRSVPNFKKMISRQNDNNLPTFMNGIHNRMFEYNLDMNTTYISNTNRNENNKTNKIEKINIKRKIINTKNSKALLKKFINLYARLHYSLEKNIRHKI